jgi:anti-anti-sigma regulatory factor
LAPGVPFGCARGGTNDMLRITTLENENDLELVLVGRLTGQWVTELTRIWATMAEGLEGRTLSLNLREVTHADDRGKQVLKYIYAQTNAKIVTRSLWTEYLAVEIMNSIHEETDAAVHA